MKKDMHIHTNFSDGEYSPKDLLKKINEAGITEFAICDHDNIDGAIIMQQLVKDKGIKFHMGVEISSRITELGINVHLLCYDFDPKNAEVNKIINDLKQKRLQKALVMIDFVKDNFNYEITEQEREKLLSENNVIGKPHIYSLIKDKITVDKERFYRIFDDLKSDNMKADSKEVLKAFHDAGGVVVLAHAIEIEREYGIDSIKAIEFLKEHGLDGLETEHSKHTEENAKRFKSYAKQFGLFESMGSDFHGETVKPEAKLGVCKKIDNDLIF